MKCPYCTQEVDARAIVCPSCRRDLILFQPILEHLATLETQITDLTASMRVSALTEQLAVRGELVTIEQATIVFILVPGIAISTFLLTTWVFLVISVAAFGLWGLLDGRFPVATGPWYRAIRLAVPAGILAFAASYVLKNVAQSYIARSAPTFSTQPFVTLLHAAEFTLFYTAIGVFAFLLGVVVSRFAAWGQRPSTAERWGFVPLLALCVAPSIPSMVEVPVLVLTILEPIALAIVAAVIVPVMRLDSLLRVILHPLGEPREL